ncbi:hypothetical protein NDU88_004596 [Pleurodeles waltl]|uniref:Uncharacterized protein n=1 Tax=Pleurodeles waltl TaxID=8319 RepID=A0AAV7T8U1_PLEWA|nr:hypothetical protein NDU88_004596 [Pleurodeles waltl]
MWALVRPRRASETRAFLAWSTTAISSAPRRGSDNKWKEAWEGLRGQGGAAGRKGRSGWQNTKARGGRGEVCQQRKEEMAYKPNLEEEE